MKSKSFSSVILGGGLDVVTPPLLVAPGRVIQMKNFECDLNQGYKLFEGYERFDGQASPVDSSFWALELDSTTGGVIGATITGDSSGATGKIISISLSGFYIVDLSNGPFTPGESFIGPESGTVLSTEIENAVISLSDDDFNETRLVKEIYYRDLILAIPGTGNVLGIWRHLEHTIAFRNKVGNAESEMWRATSSGWVLVPLGHIVFFNSAAMSILATVGATVSDGVSDTATIEAAIYNNVAENDDGYFVLSGFTAGFAVAANMTIFAQVVGTVSTAAAAITLLPDGRYEFRSHNFTGTIGFGVDPDSYNVYGADGVNSGFEWWPSRNIYVPIYTDQAFRSIDFPTYVAIYKNQLFFGFERGIIRNSENGDPYDWDAASGTIEIGVGQVVTGFDEAPSALVITTRRITYSLTGESINDFILTVISQNTGAIAHTVQHLGTTYMLDDRGIIELLRVQAFGNFENATVSRLIQATVNNLRPTIVASTVSLKKNIYRLVSSSGQGISMTIQAEAEIAFGLFDLGLTVNCMINAEDENGGERIFFGDNQGFVYEMDKGRSFDGVIRQSYMQFAYHFLGSQTVKKRFYRMYFDMLVEGKGTISTIAAYSLGSRDVKSSLSISSDLETLVSLNSAWDVATWDVATWDGQVSIADVHIDLAGTGESISLTLFHNSAFDDIFTIQDVTYHYKKRAVLRGAR